jgi:hypothetical protein
MLQNQPTLEIRQGKRGYGKTNSLKEETIDVTPLYVVDIRNEWRHLPVFRECNMFVHWLTRRGEGINIPQTEFSKEGQFRFSFAKQDEYLKLFSLMQGFQNCTIIIDEADALFTHNKFCKALIDVFLGSRNNKVNLYFVGKRPFLIPVVVRSQADTLTVFRIEEQRDIDYITKRVRADCPKDPFTLAQGEAIVFKSDEKPILKTFPKFRGEK